MKYLSIFILASVLLVSCNSSTTNPGMTTRDNRIDSLLSLMTLEEKVGQLNMYNGTWEFTGPVPGDENSQRKAEMIKKGLVGGMLNVLTAEGTMEAQKLAVENSRLGIPLVFGYDVIHGYKTMFPIPLAQAASWDHEMAKETSRIAAKEMSATGLNWAFGPVIDVAPDGRWGRIMEGAGEDPYLTSVFAKAWIQGLQGEDLSSPETVAATAKHFAGYGFAEAGLDYFTVNISDQTLYNVALPPFKAAVDAGVASVMNAFQDLNGIPATAHKKLQRDILKGEWGFDGVVLSDWASINELTTHGFAEDRRDAAIKAFEAGSDMDMESRIYEEELPALLENGTIDEALLDDAVRRILKMKFDLGLFDDPYRYSKPENEKKYLLADEHLKLAREAGRSSIVLLKNTYNTLPLSKSTRKIAVIGQLAESKDVVLGSWRAQANPNSGISILEGIESAVPESDVQFNQGYTLTTGNRSFRYDLNFVEGDFSKHDKAIKLASKSDVVIMVLGEDCFQTGEARSQADIGLKGNQEELFDKIIKANPNTVVVLMNGRPLAIPNIAAKAPAILESWFLGSEMGHAVADVLFGDYNPSGKLPVSFPHHTGQEPFYYYRKNSGRPIPNDFDANMVFWVHYTDTNKEAVFPFGHGLSYTTFEYGDPKISSSKGSVEIEVKLTNAGQVNGKETVQVYIRDLVASETQPVKRLVDFRQVQLDQGQSETLSFTLTGEDLGFYLSNGEFVQEEGEFEIFIGGNSEETKSGKVRVSF